MKEQIRELNDEPNEQLIKRFTDNGNNTTLGLNDSNLTDKDMKTVADQLRVNKVKENFSFLSFRLFM